MSVYLVEKGFWHVLWRPCTGAPAWRPCTGAPAHLLTLITDILVMAFNDHLCFKQAQPKMCHSPKVDDGVDIFFKVLEHLFLGLFLKELLIAIKPKPLELLT